MKGDIRTARLILAVVTTIAQEAAIALIVLIGLPRIDIKIPVSGLIAILIVWGIIAVSLYRAGSRALLRKPLPGLPKMIDSKGKVVTTLNPQGMVKLRGELWDAMSFDGKKINAGEKIIVVAQDGLKLTVRKSNQKKK